jgi:Na+-translocating ferredoxin:NAD+ oxidoreductase RnfD subunit
MDQKTIDEPTPAPISAAPAATAPAASATAPSKKFKIHPQYIAPLLITGVLLSAWISFGVIDYRQLALAIGSAMVTELALGRLFFRKWPHLASAYVTGISVAIIIQSPFLWTYAVCSVISIASKYVLRIKDRHPWNPSNFGISSLLLLAPAAATALSVQFGNSYWAMGVIWVLGSVIIWRLKRFHICATYAISFVLFSLVRAAIEHQPFLTEVAPITGPPYQLFIFFMITDPKSTVHARIPQMVVAFLVAAVEAVFRLIHNTSFLGQPLYVYVHAPYFALFLVGPTAVLIEIFRNAKKKQAAPKAAGAPAS